MINISGFLIIIFGFAAPFLSGGRVPSIFFFWAGFLLLLWPSRYFPKTSWRSKWARSGVVLNILGTLFLLLFVYIITHPFFSFGYFAFQIFKVVGLLFKPVSSISDFIFPQGQMIMPDGSARSTVSFIRATVTSFGDVLTYVFIGLIIGRIKNKKPK